MAQLEEMLLKMEVHNSVFESSVRELPLPVCAAFGNGKMPLAVGFATTKQQLGTKDSERVAKAFSRFSAVGRGLAQLRPVADRDQPEHRARQARRGSLLGRPGFRRS